MYYLLHYYNTTLLFKCYYFISLSQYLNTTLLSLYMEKKGKDTQSIRINPELWKEVRVYVAKNDTNISSFIEQAIREKLDKKK